VKNKRIQMPEAQSATPMRSNRKFRALAKPSCLFLLKNYPAFETPRIERARPAIFFFFRNILIVSLPILNF